MGTRFSLVTTSWLSDAALSAFSEHFDGSAISAETFAAAWKDVSYDGGVDVALGALAEVAKALMSEGPEQPWITVALLSNEGDPLCLKLKYGDMRLLLGTPDNAEHVAAYRKYCFQLDTRGNPIIASKPDIAGVASIPLAD